MLGLSHVGNKVVGTVELQVPTVCGYLGEGGLITWARCFLKAGYLTVLVPHVTAGVIFGDTRALISYRRKEKQGPIVAGGRLGSVPLWTTQLVCFSPLAQEEQEVMGRPSLSRDDEEGEGRVLTRQGPDLDFCIEDRLGGWGGALNTEKL